MESKDDPAYAGFFGPVCECGPELKRLRRVEEVVKKHYPTIAGHVIRLQEAHEDRAAAEWLQVARDFYEHTQALRPYPPQSIV